MKAFAPAGGIPRHVWLRMARAEALAAQGRKCKYCFEPMTLSTSTADHVDPRSKGGLDHPSNIVAACGPCNLAKGSMSAGEFLKRIKNPGPEDSILIWLAHFRRRLWHATHQACFRITRQVVPMTGRTWKTAKRRPDLPPGGKDSLPTSGQEGGQ